ncbi:hypothetical protein BX600DRAFT_438490 [Xylariales sp. PMI_506]|nr:hypothetical protein BX600DRAFT_438490 [Xylariales sp. PMI_506]
MASSDLPILYRDSTDPAVFQEAVWSRVYNFRRNTSRVPRAVVKPTKVEHIKEALAIAKESNCRVSIRSGGRSFAIWSVRHDSILIDLGDYKFVEYDEQSMTVTCSPTVTGKDVQALVNPKGRMFPSGHMSHVGLGGFLLGGGFGWNSMNAGQACELIESLDVITADGEELHCSATENTELFWLAHGAGPGFPAIVTKFVLQTWPYYGMYMSMVAWPVGLAAQALPWAVEACKTHADPDTEYIICGMQPEHSPVPAFALIAFSFKKDKKEAEQFAQALYAGRPEGAVVERIFEHSSVIAASEFLDATVPPGCRCCDDTAWLSDEADVAHLIRKSLETLPSRYSSIIYMPRPVPDIEKTAFSITSHHFFQLTASWKEVKEDEKCIEWVHKTYESLGPLEISSAVNGADYQVREYKFWSPENAAKIMELRRKWDPQGRICGYLDAGDKSGIQGLKTRS